MTKEEFLVIANGMYDNFGTHPLEINRYLEALWPHIEKALKDAGEISQTLIIDTAKTYRKFGFEDGWNAAVQECDKIATKMYRGIGYVSPYIQESIDEIHKLRKET